MVFNLVVQFDQSLDQSPFIRRTGKGDFLCAFSISVLAAAIVDVSITVDGGRPYLVCLVTILRRERIRNQNHTW